MPNFKNLLNIDFRSIILMLLLMGISLLVISSMTATAENNSFFTQSVKNQLQWFVLGWIVFIFFAAFDYRKFYQWTWFLYFFMILLLLGLYVVSPIQRVHRWYRLPFIGMNIQ